MRKVISLAVAVLFFFNSVSFGLGVEGVNNPQTRAGALALNHEKMMRGSDSPVAEACKRVGKPETGVRKPGKPETGEVKRTELLGFIKMTLEGVIDVNMDDFRDAALALAAEHDKEAVKPLMEVLRSNKDAYARAVAAKSLGIIGDREAVENLILALEDENATVRENAAVALGMMLDQRARGPLLRKEAEDENEDVRAAAERASTKLELDRLPDGGGEGSVEAAAIVRQEIRDLVKKGQLYAAGAKATKALCDRTKGITADDVRKWVNKSFLAGYPEHAGNIIFYALDINSEICKGLFFEEVLEWADRYTKEGGVSYSLTLDEKIRRLAELLPKKGSEGSEPAMTREEAKRLKRETGGMDLDESDLFGEKGAKVKKNIEDLKNRDWETRVVALFNLGRLGSLEAAKAAEEVLGDPNINVRLMARDALIEMGHDPEKLAMRKRGERGLPGGGVSLESYAKSGNIDGLVKQLRELGFTSNDVKIARQLVKRHCPQLLSTFNHIIGLEREAIKARTVELRYGDQNARLNAVWSLNRVGGRRAIRYLIMALGDTDLEVRFCARRVLSDRGEKKADEVVEPVIQALESRNPSVRYGAALVLCTIGDSRAIEPLEKMLRSEDSFSREQFSEIKGKLDALREKNLGFSSKSAISGMRGVVEMLGRLAVTDGEKGKRAGRQGSEPAMTREEAKRLKRETGGMDLFDDEYENVKRLITEFQLHIEESPSDEKVKLAAVEALAPLQMHSNEKIREIARFLDEIAIGSESVEVKLAAIEAIKPLINSEIDRSITDVYHLTYPLPFSRIFRISTERSANIAVKCAGIKAFASCSDERGFVRTCCLITDIALSGGEGTYPTAIKTIMALLKNKDPKEARLFILKIVGANNEWEIDGSHYSDCVKLAASEALAALRVRQDTGEWKSETPSDRLPDGRGEGPAEWRAEAAKLLNSAVERYKNVSAEPSPRAVPPSIPMMHKVDLYTTLAAANAQIYQTGDWNWRKAAEQNALRVDTPLAFALLARMHLEIGDKEKAVQYIKKAMDMENGHYPASQSPDGIESHAFFDARESSIISYVLNNLLAGGVEDKDISEARNIYSQALGPIVETVRSSKMSFERLRALAYVATYGGISIGEFSMSSGEFLREACDGLGVVVEGWQRGDYKWLTGGDGSVFRMEASITLVEFSRGASALGDVDNARALLGDALTYFGLIGEYNARKIAERAIALAEADLALALAKKAGMQEAAAKRPEAEGVSDETLKDYAEAGDIDGLFTLLKRYGLIDADNVMRVRELLEQFHPTKLEEFDKRAEEFLGEEGKPETELSAVPAKQHGGSTTLLGGSSQPSAGAESCELKADSLSAQTPPQGLPGGGVPHKVLKELAEAGIIKQLVKQLGDYGFTRFDVAEARLLIRNRDKAAFENELNDAMETKRIERLVKDLESKDPDVQLEAKMDLLEFGVGNNRREPKMVRFLGEKLKAKDTRSNARLWMMDVLSKITTHGAMKLWIHLLKDPDPNIRCCAAKELNKMFYVEAVAPLIEALKDSYWKVRRNAVESLGQMADKKKVMRPVIGMLRDGDIDVRDMAASVLSEIGDQSAIKPLSKAGYSEAIEDIKRRLGVERGGSQPAAAEWELRGTPERDLAGQETGNRSTEKKLTPEQVKLLEPINYVVGLIKDGKHPTRVYVAESFRLTKAINDDLANKQKKDIPLYVTEGCNAREANGKNILTLLQRAYNAGDNFAKIIMCDGDLASYISGLMKNEDNAKYFRNVTVVRANIAKGKNVDEDTFLQAKALSEAIFSHWANESPASRVLLLGLLEEGALKSIGSAAFVAGQTAALETENTPFEEIMKRVRNFTSESYEVAVRLVEELTVQLFIIGSVWAYA